MNVLKFDSVGGASGDMILGALVGLGASIDTITETLQSMDLDPFFLSQEEVVKEGIQAKKVNVHVGREEHPSDSTDHHPHPHSSGHSHAHRHLSDIIQLIEGGDCAREVKIMAKQIFQRLGEAEAAVHGIPVETVHFHEVGAMDSIVDILGACVAYHQLGVEGAVCGPLPVGQGWFDCAHGRYPLPPPATEKLLQGFPTQPTDISTEMVTPTGAAILTTWHHDQWVGKPYTVIKSAFGAGERDVPGRPNVLRASLVELAAEPELLISNVMCLETNIDDTDGEILAYVQQRLLNAGALDVVLIPCTMKKGRPGTLLQVLCEAPHREAVENLIFRETGTLGIRRSELARTILDRKELRVQTRYGEVTVKVAYLSGNVRSVKPEMDECIHLAEKHDIPVEKIRLEAVRAYAP